MTGSLTRRRALQVAAGIASGIGSGIVSGIVSGLAAAGSVARAEGGPEAPGRFARGVNAWPWLAMPAADPPAGQPYPDWPPYLPGRPVPTGADLRGLAAAGLDFVRLVVDPAPFLNLSPPGGAASPRASTQAAELVALLERAVLAVDAAGLGAVVNLQPGGSPRWTAARLYGPAAAPEDFGRYRDLAGALAGALGRLPVARLAFEPVNEPSQDAATVGGRADWDGRQAALLGAARAAAPSLALVATGAGGGGPAGLRALDGRQLDARFRPLLFTFHFYEPFLFSHQGAPWLAAGEPHYRWLNGVPWPGADGSLQGTLRAVRARMAADRRTPAAAKEAAYATTERVMRDYFDAGVDRRYLDPFFAGVAGWAAGHGIAPGRVLVGEFGALRSTTAAPDTWDAPQQSATGGPYVAAEPADRARYLRDVRLAAEARGFGWAMWTLFNPGMGLMDETSRVLDPALVPALGLKPG